MGRLSSRLQMSSRPTTAVRDRHLVNLCSISAWRRRCADSTDREPNVNHEWNSVTSVTRKMRETHEPRIARMSRIAFLTKGRKRMSFCSRSNRDLVSFVVFCQNRTPTARWAVAPCHSLLTYFCIRAICGDTLTSVQGRRRFFQSKGRRAADPKTAAVSIRHSLVSLDSAGQW